MTNDMKIDSCLYSLADIVAQPQPWLLNVPLYQRLYVWGEDQVGTLLADLVGACRRDEPLFFLGGMLLVDQTGDSSGSEVDRHAQCSHGAGGQFSRATPLAERQGRRL